MGKKSSFKKIRKLAEQMPVIQTRQVIVERVSGAELIKRGIEEVDGNKVDIDIDYREKKVISVPINHNRKMKKLYNKYGVLGVGAYVSQVKRFIASQEEDKNGENGNRDNK